MANLDDKQSMIPDNDENGNSETDQSAPFWLECDQILDIGFLF